MPVSGRHTPEDIERTGVESAVMASSAGTAYGMIEHIRGQVVATGLRNFVRENRPSRGQLRSQRADRQSCDGNSLFAPRWVTTEASKGLIRFWSRQSHFGQRSRASSFRIAFYIG